MPTRRTMVLSSAAVATVAVLAALAVRGPGGTEPVRRAAAEPPATTTSTTATTVPPADPWRTTIATAVVPMVAVAEATPPGVTLTPAQVASRAAAWASYPAYGATPAARRPLPSPSEPLQGRRRTPTGWEFDNPGGFGSPLTFVVTQQAGDWLQVMIPVRPNGGEGWIRATDVTLTTTTFHLEISVGRRTATLVDGTTPVLTTPVVVGRPATWTPTGRFYITDAKAEPAGSVYGPWILATDAYSPALDDFSDGAPVVALHGTNQPQLLGSASSNGCIRFPNAVIARLHDTVPLGTPVDITP